MDLVDEQHRLEQAALGALHHLAGVGHAGGDGRQRDQLRADRLGQDRRQGGLAGAGRAPQDQRGQGAAIQQLLQRAARPDEVLLPDELGGGPWAHPRGERLVAHGALATRRTG